MVSQYEEIRKKNIEDNRRILAELGILNPFKPLGKVVKKSVKRKRHSGGGEWVPKKRAVEVDEDYEAYGSIHGSRRRSSRIQGQAAPSVEELREEVDKFVEEEQHSRLKVKPNRPNFYGAVADVEIGTVWQTRMEACHAGVHRPTVAGIHGGEEGAFSIALSGGYEDDIDLGECFTYTGEGGRDLKGTKSNPKNLRTAAQSKDQTLTRGNLALSRNVDTGNPVRVLRGYKLRSPFAPEEGYRYDGLYSVEKAWFTVGLSGFGVWKFALRRCELQAASPWTILDNDKQLEIKHSEDILSPETRRNKVKDEFSDETLPNSNKPIDSSSTDKLSSSYQSKTDDSSSTNKLSSSSQSETVDNSSTNKLSSSSQSETVDSSSTNKLSSSSQSETVDNSSTDKLSSSSQSETVDSSSTNKLSSSSQSETVDNSSTDKLSSSQSETVDNSSTNKLSSSSQSETVDNSSTNKLSSSSQSETVDNSSSQTISSPADLRETDVKSESDSGIESDSGSVGKLQRSNSETSEESTASGNQSDGQGR